MTKDEAQTCIFHAEHEFKWLMLKLGYSEFQADLKAFALTEKLSNYLRDLQTLWDDRLTAERKVTP